MRFLAIAALLVVLSATPAFAHAEFDPDDAAPGSVATVALNVEDERDSASIVKVELSPPSDSAVAMADPTAATEGWTGTVLADRVEWSGPPADGDQSFGITLGPLPDQDGARLQFGALVTYDNGDVDRWIEAFPIDGPEPDMPGPVLDLVAGAPGEVPAAPDTVAGEEPTVAPESSTTLEVTPLESADSADSAADEADDDDDDGRGFPVRIVGLLVIVGLIVGGIMIWRRRRWED